MHKCSHESTASQQQLEHALMRGRLCAAHMCVLPANPMDAIELLDKI